MYSSTQQSTKYAPVCPDMEMGFMDKQNIYRTKEEKNGHRLRIPLNLVPADITAGIIYITQKYLIYLRKKYIKVDFISFRQIFLRYFMKSYNIF